MFICNGLSEKGTEKVRLHLRSTHLSNRLVQPKGMVFTRDRTKELRSYDKNTSKCQMDNKRKPLGVTYTGCSASDKKASGNSRKELNETWVTDLKQPSPTSGSQTSPQLSPLTMFLLPESDKGAEAENSKELPSSKKRLYTLKLGEKLQSKARKLN